MPLTDKQREARILERGRPVLSLEFDVFDDGSVSMWTHFDHSADFGVTRRQLHAIKEHLDAFLADEAMCPFHGLPKGDDKT